MHSLDANAASALIVTDFLPSGAADVSDALQKIIDEHPNRTLFFPDGVYPLAKPILTPADPKSSVSLQLSAYAVIKAAETWDSPEAMIRLGGKLPANDIRTNGSNYYLEGGIIDGNGKANGISIDGGRETGIRNTSIKHTPIGIHIKKGPNGAGSSDADIHSVNIVGTGGTDSIGVLVEGLDNTLTNMRIANVFIGVDLRGSGNFLRNIHPLYTSDYTDYSNSCGFRDQTGGNWYNNCYSDQFGNGFRITKSSISILDSCHSYWYSDKGGTHTAIRADAQFNCVCNSFRAGSRRFEPGRVNSIVLSIGEAGGKGTLNTLIATPGCFTDEAADSTFRAYLNGPVIP